MKRAFRSMLVIIFLSGHFSVAVSKTEVFFSPDDQPAKKLINLINHARDKIYAAIYMITDYEISHALISAKKRGVDVKIIVDASSVKAPYGKGKLLKKNNINVFVFSPPTQAKTNFTPLMHNKFALIDNQLWTGSFNWTKLANHKNQENVILTDNKDVCARFEKHFHVLKNRCKHYGFVGARPPHPPMPTVPIEQSWGFMQRIEQTLFTLFCKIKQTIDYLISGA